MEHEAVGKYEGRASAKLTGPTAEQVWPLLENFFSIHKWLPGVDTCHQVEGLSGQPGCVRYCAGSSSEETIKWAKEKLLTMDPIQRCFSYKVIDNNMGINSYVATIKLLAAEGDDNRGCMIEWSFVVDSVEGWGLEGLASYIDSSLQVMAKRIEEALM